MDFNGSCCSFSHAWNRISIQYIFIVETAGISRVDLLWEATPWSKDEEGRRGGETLLLRLLYYCVDEVATGNVRVP